MMTDTPARRLAIALLVLAATATVGCTRPQESAGVAAGTKAPDVVAVRNDAWGVPAGSSQPLKIVVVNVTAHGETTLAWQDFRLHTTKGLLAPSSAYVRLPNGSSFGWSADRTLADNGTLSVELHYHPNGTTQEPTMGVYDSAAWRVTYTLPSPTAPSPPLGR